MPVPDITEFKDNAHKIVSAIQDLRDDPAWQAEVTLARHTIVEAIAVEKEMTKESQREVDSVMARLQDSPDDPAIWNELVALGLDHQSSLAQYRVLASRWYHEPLKRLASVLRTHNPEIQAKAAQAILLEWLLGAEFMSDDNIHATFRLWDSRVGPGRPQKLPEDQPTPQRSRSRIDPALARRAYSLHADGAHWRVIAKNLWPDETLTNSKQRDRIRKRIDRLVYRGRLLIQS